MYLVDLVANIQKELKADPLMSVMLQMMPNYNMIEFYLRETDNILQNYDLYAFEKSALIAASDVRVDRQTSLEAVAEMVFSKPRKQYFEADFAERMAAFQHIPNMPERDDDLLVPPTRSATTIESFGGGKGQIRAVWSMPKNAIDANIIDAFAQSIGIKSNDRKRKKLLQNIMRLNVSYLHVDIDLTKRSKMSRDEFATRVAEGDKDASFFFNLQKERLSATKTPKQVMSHAWDMYRLNSFCRSSIKKDPLIERCLVDVTRSHPDLTVEQAHDVLRADLDGEALYGIAMSAAIMARQTQIKSHKPSSLMHRPSKKKAKSRTPKAALIDDNSYNLGVVSLNISKDLQDALIDKGRSETRDHGGEGQGLSKKRKSPIRHPVNGYLFRARNGEIMYREPYFRGVEGTTVHKVK